MKQKTKPQPLDLEEIKIIISDIGKKAEQLVNYFKYKLKSACEFYLRYKDKPKLLIKEHPEYEAEFINSDFKLVRFPLPPMKTAFFIELEDGELDKYNDWLFKLAFKDIFK